MPKHKLQRHQKHKLYKIVPAMKLDNETLSAFMGTRYHFNEIKKIFNSPAIQTSWEDEDEITKRKMQYEVDRFHWHLRAFFWEIVSTFDTMLQWANQRYELGVAESEVHWDHLPKKSGKDQGEWKKKYSLLKNVWESEWFFEVRMYRNFAHRSFLFIQGDWGSTLNLLILSPVREGQPQCVDILQQLSDYMERMRLLGENIFPKIP